MALIEAEGFDTRYDEAVTYAPRWGYVGAHVDLGGRRGGPCMGTFGWGVTNNYARYWLPSELTTVIVSAAILPLYHATALVRNFIGCYYDNTDIQCMLRYDSHGRIYAEHTMGGAEIGESADGALTLGIWNYVEMKFTIGSSGSIVVKVDGDVVLNLTGVNTQAYGSGGTDYIRFGTSWEGNSWDTCLWDDMVIMDTTGSTFKDFLGDVKVEGFAPTADGYYTDFTPLSAGSHYVEIYDQRGPLGVTTTYNTASVVEDKDSFTFTISGDLPTILAVAVRGAINNPDTGIASVRPFFRIDGVDYDADDLWDLGNSVLEQNAWFEENPATSSAWTKTVLESAEFGYAFEAAS